MNTQIQIKSIHDLKAHEYSRLDKLTFGRDGCMSDRLACEHSNPDSRSMVFMCKSGNGHILGWGLAFTQLRSCKAKFGLYLYVEEKHRRSGFGSDLVAAAKEALADIQVFPFDKPSRLFYAMHQKQVAITADELRAIKRIPVAC